MKKKISGEDIQRYMLKVLPKNRLSDFERNFVAYKLAEHLNILHNNKA